MEPKEQDVVSRVKRYFDLVEIMNNLWRINLLIIVISHEHKYIYSEGSVTLTDFIFKCDLNFREMNANSFSKGRN